MNDETRLNAPSPDRLAKLPRWAQQYINRLESDAAKAKVTAEWARRLAENERKRRENAVAAAHRMRDKLRTISTTSQ